MRWRKRDASEETTSVPLSEATASIEALQRGSAFRVLHGALWLSGAGMPVRTAQMKLHLDFETRSEVDLRVVGAWKYAMHPSTEIMCIGYAVDNDEPKVWPRPFKVPAVSDDPSMMICAHNAAFEYAIYHCILHKRYGWPKRSDPKLWSCTLARAAMVGLPLDLDSLGRVLQIKTPKDLEGRRIMLQLCKPRGFDALGEAIWDETPEKLQKLYAYNATDVKAEMEVDALLPEMSENERKIWELDLIANARGVAVDLDVCRKASSLAGKITTDLNEKLRELTGGKVDKATQTAALKIWITSQGVAIPTKEDKDGTIKETVDKAAIIGLLSDPSVPPRVRDAISIRQQVGKSSTAKYDKAIATAGPDGRVRGVLQYHAAHTGRWGGRLIQPQNYPKGFGTTEEQERCIGLMDSPDTFSLVYGDKAMEALSDALRGTIVAGPGKVLVAADYNAIEARVEMWLADEQSALAAYRRGDSPYVDLARAIYNDETITKKTHPKEYDLGKRAFLGFGYGMGAAKFKVTCKIQANIDISDEFAERAKDVYRDKYAAVVRMWYATEVAAISAVRNPKQHYAACGGKVLFGMSSDQRFLVCRLPSGRYLWYWRPSVRRGKTPWGEEKDELCYQGEDSKTHQWVTLKTYGGALVENITQAVARDIMAGGMLRCDASGFPLLFTCHDEDISEIEESRVRDSTLGDFLKFLCDIEPWAKGCPVAAEGWIGKRYRK